ncbi:MAG: thioredoxin family protein [Myxococcales bacterium]|nr:thioredoxin family protein [Myxococcales bacterium]
MRLGLFFVGCLSLVGACRDEPIRSDLKPAEVGADKATGPKLVFVKAPEGDVVAAVKRAQADATAAGQRLVVYVGAPWCEPCKHFHEAVESGKLDAKLPRIRLLEFDLDLDETRLAQAGYVTKYIPLFALAGPDGRSNGKQIAGSIKGEGAADEITPRLLQLLR